MNTHKLYFLYMETFRQRLDFAFKQNGITQAKFARLMDTESQNVNLWKVRGGIPRSHFIKACDILSANPSWLSEGKGHWEQSKVVKEQPKVYAATPQPGDISNLLSVTTPRSSAILEKLAAKLSNHELSDADMEIIEAIADRFTK